MIAANTPSREEDGAAVQMLLAQLIVAENGSALNGAITIPKQTIQASVYDKAIAAANRLAAKPADAGVREALQPFAKIADDYERAEKQRHSHHADEGRPAGPPYPDSHRVSISLGDCRNARAALSTKAKP